MSDDTIRCPHCEQSMVAFGLMFWRCEKCDKYFVVNVVDVTENVKGMLRNPNPVALITKQDNTHE